MTAMRRVPPVRTAWAVSLYLVVLMFTAWTFLAQRQTDRDQDTLDVARSFQGCEHDARTARLANQDATALLELRWDTATTVATVLTNYGLRSRVRGELQRSFVVNARQYRTQIQTVPARDRDRVERQLSATGHITPPVEFQPVTDCAARFPNGIAASRRYPDALTVRTRP